MNSKKTLILIGVLTVISLCWYYFSVKASQGPLLEGGLIEPSPSTLTETDQAPPSPVQVISFEKDKLYLLINAHRKDHDLTPLATNPLLETSAQLKISDMVKNKYYRHEDVQNIQSWYLLKQVGYTYQSAGENLSFSYNTPWQVFNAWLESPAHNEQLLTPEYRDMGLAIDCETLAKHASGGCMVVLHVGAR